MHFVLGRTNSVSNICQQICGKYRLLYIKWYELGPSSQIRGLNAGTDRGGWIWIISVNGTPGVDDGSISFRSGHARATVGRFASLPTSLTEFH